VLESSLVRAEVGELSEFLGDLDEGRKNNLQVVNNLPLLLSNAVPLLVEFLYLPKHL
jgi:hypothetical protein